MFKSKKKFLIIAILLQLLLFPKVLGVTGEQPVIASRISEISEIIINHDPGFYKPGVTFFGIQTEVEILNRAEENQSVIELEDCIPKICINASFVNPSLKLEALGICHATITTFSYPPGITVEYEFIEFFINQTGLSQLPDGNYTLWRPINTASKFGYIDPAEQFTTILTVNIGIITIIYHSFYYTYTEEVSSDTQTPDQTTDETIFSLTSPLVFIFLLSFLIIVYKRRKTITN